MDRVMRKFQPVREQKMPAIYGPNGRTGLKCRQCFRATRLTEPTPGSYECHYCGFAWLGQKGRSLEIENRPMPLATDAAWAAGVFEHRASLTVVRPKAKAKAYVYPPYPYVVLSMRNPDGLEVLTRFLAVVGCGSISHQRHKRRGEAPATRYIAIGFTTVGRIQRILSPYLTPAVGLAKLDRMWAQFQEEEAGDETA